MLAIGESSFCRFGPGGRCLMVAFRRVYAASFPVAMGRSFFGEFGRGCLTVVFCNIWRALEILFFLFINILPY